MTKLKNKKKEKINPKIQNLPEHQLILKIGKGEKIEHSPVFPT